MLTKFDLPTPYLKFFYTEYYVDFNGEGRFFLE